MAWWVWQLFFNAVDRAAWVCQFFPLHWMCYGTGQWQIELLVSGQPLSCWCSIWCVGPTLQEYSSMSWMKVIAHALTFWFWFWSPRHVWQDIFCCFGFETHLYRTQWWLRMLAYSPVCLPACCPCRHIYEKIHTTFSETGLTIYIYILIV